jgi:hypothetical protein
MRPAIDRTIPGTAVMDLFLVLGLIHVVGGLAWAASVLVLGLILRAARRDDDATLRALPEVAHLTRRVLHPAILATTLSGLALAGAGGLLAEAWVVLSTALSLAALALGRTAVAPACERARGMPRAAALFRGRLALRLAGQGLGLQAAAIALMVLTPGWSGAAIFAGLVACLVLALALLREADGHATPA